jgi:hypothetical protein
MTVAMQAAHIATIRVFFTAWRVSASRNSSTYHFREKPENTDRLRASLKENTSSMAMGANRKMKISAV